MNHSIADIRKDYKLKTLREDEVSSDPVEQFIAWWSEAVNSKIEEVNAMTLATASVSGIPSARIVLLKGVSKEGFTFFTNYESSKGKELANNPFAALVFFWKELERQVRIEGMVEKVSEAESKAYFSSRPVASRIGAWASPQSTIIHSREILEENVIKYESEFGNEDIPKPPHWGGYLVKPNKFEFWQGRSSRLHDRIVYALNQAKWNINRLAP